MNIYALRRPSVLAFQARNDLADLIRIANNGDDGHTTPAFGATELRAFGGFIKQYGAEFLLECLEKNERNGMMYHYPGTLTGDYDMPNTEDEIIDMILTGIKNG
ncbi:MAG: hypothetical protein JW793_09960 [Acidobacteria bacterium]|nr:hypothetical protein [Acidobacteriota bacterium]